MKIVATVGRVAHPSKVLRPLVRRYPDLFFGAQLGRRGSLDGGRTQDLRHRYSRGTDDFDTRHTDHSQSLASERGVSCMVVS